MKSYMCIPPNKLSLFQELVKLHNLRFVGNPIKIGDNFGVTISSEHLAPGAELEFFADWRRLNTPIRELEKTVWSSNFITQFLKKLFN